MLKAFHSLKHKHEDDDDHNKKVSGLQLVITPEDLPKSLDEILEHDEWLEQFRQHLRQRLALENLLFYEGIELYQSIDESKSEMLNKAGVFMLKQFIEEDSEDMINISSPLRKQLLQTEVFQVDTFSFAKSEVYDLMESNFLSSFKRDLQGMESDLNTNDSTDMDSANGSSKLSMYMQEISFEEIRKLDNVDADKVAKFLKKGCGSRCKYHNPSMNKFCCERQRVVEKLLKMEKKKPCSMKTCVNKMITKLSPVMLFGVELEPKKTGTRMLRTKKTKQSGSFVFNHKFNKNKTPQVVKKQLNL